MAKAGDDYQEIVGSVQRALDPGSTVEVGIWVVGPDGRRDMDVAISGVKDGRPHLTLIECKDWKTPVEIGVIDALDSKRRDLAADAAIVFSNSGFTDGAVRKSARTGISLACALKAGDPRIRVKVWREFIAKRRVVDRWTLKVFWNHERGDPGELIPHDISWNGAPLVNWISQESSKILRELPEGPVPAWLTAEYSFNAEVPFKFRERSVRLTGLAFRLECSGGCVRQVVREDVSLGSYDFLKHRVSVPDQQTYMLGPFDNEAWEDTTEVPPGGELEPGTFRVDLTILRPVIPVLGVGVPGLDTVVAERALTLG